MHYRLINEVALFGPQNVCNVLSLSEYRIGIFSRSAGKLGGNTDVFR